MNRLTCIVSTLVLLSCSISCKKDKDSDSNKTRLSKLIGWRTANPSQYIVVTEFRYDAQERVAEIASFIGDSVNGEIKKTTDFRNIKFLYNGNDKNPYKSIGGMSNISMAGQETYHYYNSDGVLIRDSIGGTPPYPGYKKDYFYYPGKIIVQTEKTSNLVDKITKDSFIVADHNLSDGFMFISSYSPQASGYKVTYDSKINPISKLNIANVTTVTGPNGFPNFLAPGFCKNNITGYTQGNSSEPGQFTGMHELSYSYSYHVNGLPKECRYFMGISDVIVKYYYTE